MKIAILTDTHWGTRQDHDAFYSNFEKFYENVFFPTLEEREISRVFHLGDLYDRRRYINFKTASEAERIFLNPLSSLVDSGKINEVIILAGNHDLYYRDVNDINSLNVLLGKYNFNVLLHPSERTYGSRKILFLPWICESNKDASLALIKNTDSSVVMGHLELSGYEMYRGVVQDHGMPGGVFSHFQSVYSGHYHHKSTKGNITYLGATNEYTWSDYNDPRGFHIYDTESDTMEFIRNPYTMFDIVVYDDSSETLPSLSKDLTNKFCKVLVTNKTNPYLFDKFMDEIYKSSPLDVQVIEDGLMGVSGIDDQPSQEEVKDTSQIISESVESMSTNLDKTRLKNEMISLYNEAIAIGSNE